jgi:hypothetical protein
MSYWKRDGDTVTGHFTREQLLRLRWYMDDFQMMIMDALECESAVHDGADMAHPGHSWLLESSRRAAAIVSWRTQLSSVDVSPFHQERDFLWQMATDVALVLDTLRWAGEVILLSQPAHLNAWIWTVQEFRLDLAFRHTLPDHEAPGRPVTLSETDQPSTPTMNWLLDVLNSLLDAIDFSAWLRPDGRA